MSFLKCKIIFKNFWKSFLLYKRIYILKEEYIFIFICYKVILYFNFKKVGLPLYTNILPRLC